MQKNQPSFVPIPLDVLNDAVAFTSNYFRYVRREKAHDCLALSAKKLFDATSGYLPESFFESPEIKALFREMRKLDEEGKESVENAVLQECGFYPTDEEYTVPIDCAVFYDSTESADELAPEKNCTDKKIAVPATILAGSIISFLAIAAIRKKHKKG